jgi:hypothetical protein
MIKGQLSLAHVVNVTKNQPNLTKLTIYVRQHRLPNLS